MFPRFRVPRLYCCLRVSYLSSRLYYLSMRVLSIVIFNLY
nr:MAG TPA: hypothetical protein [Caudoviricetes sp.]